MICPHWGNTFKTAITDKQIKQIFSLHKKGYSCRDIAAVVGCSFASVSRLLREEHFNEPESK